MAMADNDHLTVKDGFNLGVGFTIALWLVSSFCTFVGWVIVELAREVL